MADSGVGEWEGYKGPAGSDGEAPACDARAQVYLGKWHNSEVAIKCLNPTLFYSGGEGAASRAAIADLLREATLLSSLRHPNVVWVYGVVLPKMKVRLKA